MRRATPALIAGLLAVAASSGCVVHKHYAPKSPPPPPPSHVHVHTEYCTVYTEMYGCSHADIVWLETNGCLWDDMGILFYLWWGSGRRYAIHDLHRWHYNERASWHVCFSRARVDMYGMFVNVDYDPGGPYGHAYGYYRRREPVERFELRDDDVRAVFRVNVGVNYYKRPPREAFEHGRSREDFHQYVRTEHVRQSRPAWEQTPQGRREVEQESRGRGPGAAPAPGRGGDARDDDRGRAPDTSPSPGRGNDNRNDERGRAPGADRQPDDRRPPTPPPGADRERDDRRPPDAPPPGASRGGDRPPESRRPDDKRPDDKKRPDDSRDRDDSDDRGQGGGKKK